MIAFGRAGRHRSRYLWKHARHLTESLQQTHTSHTQGLTLSCCGLCLQVNQVRGLYVEDSNIYGSAPNGVALDGVSVQYGHVCRSDIHHADWCMYLKGEGRSRDKQEASWVRVGIRSSSVSTSTQKWILVQLAVGKFAEHTGCCWAVCPVLRAAFGNRKTRGRQLPLLLKVQPYTFEVLFVVTVGQFLWLPAQQMGGTREQLSQACVGLFKS